MKNWKKYALASASVIALGATLAACGNLTGNNKKSAPTATVSHHRNTAKG